MGERPHAGLLDRPDQPAGLIPPLREARVHSRDEQHAAPGRAREVQAPVLQDLRLQALQEPQLIAVTAVPAPHRTSLEGHTLGVEAVDACEPASVIGHDSP